MSKKITADSKDPKNLKLPISRDSSKLSLNNIKS